MVDKGGSVKDMQVINTPDWSLSAEAAGTTVSRGGRRHYLLADIALVGEAIMLAMRTNVKS